MWQMYSYAAAAPEEEEGEELKWDRETLPEHVSMEIVPDALKNTDVRNAKTNKK